MCVCVYIYIYTHVCVCVRFADAAFFESAYLCQALAQRAALGI